MRILDPTKLGHFRLGNLWLRRSLLKNESAIREFLTTPIPGRSPLMQYSITRTHLIIPRHTPLPGEDLSDVLDMVPPPEVLPQFEDRVNTFLDEEQERSWKALSKMRNGIFSIPGGRGKTVLAAKKICQEGVATIVFVHTTTILEQWKTQLVSKAGIPEKDIGLLIGKRMELEKPIVLASVPTVIRHPYGFMPEEKNRFGLAIYDECHHIGAPQFSSIAPIFRGNRIGLTATPRRADGTEAVYMNHLGPVQHFSRYHTLSPIVKFRMMPATSVDLEKAKDCTGEFSFSKFWTLLGKDEARNGLLLRDVRELRKPAESGRRRKILILTHSVRHAKILHNAIPESGLLIGEVARQKRQGELGKNVVIAYREIAAEALDKVDLDTLMMTMPTGAERVFSQATFRVLRDIVEKEPPLHIVYVDPFPPCVSLCRKMFRMALEANYEVACEGISDPVGRVHTMPSLQVEKTLGFRGGRGLPPSIDSRFFAGKGGR